MTTASEDLRHQIVPRWLIVGSAMACAVAVPPVIGILAYLVPESAVRHGLTLGLLLAAWFAVHCFKLWRQELRRSRLAGPWLWVCLAISLAFMIALPIWLLATDGGGTFFWLADVDLLNSPILPPIAGH